MTETQMNVDQLEYALKFGSALFQQSMQMTNEQRDSQQTTIEGLLERIDLAQAELYLALEYVAPRSEAADCIRAALDDLAGHVRPSLIAQQEEFRGLVDGSIKR